MCRSTASLKTRLNQWGGCAFAVSASTAPRGLCCLASPAPARGHEGADLGTKMPPLHHPGEMHLGQEPSVRSVAFKHCLSLSKASAHRQFTI